MKSHTPQNEESQPMPKDGGLEPARTIIEFFSEPGRAGEAVLADVLKIDRTTPYKWPKSKRRHGTGGLIPGRHHIKILTYAEAIGKNLSPEHLMGISLPCAKENAA
jgi:hypothetical protein